MSEVVDRRVVLGGESRGRGIVGGARSVLEWLGLLVGVGSAVPVLLTGPVTIWRVAAAAAVVAGAWAVWTPMPGRLGGRSVAAVAAGEARFRVRRRREPVFRPGERWTLPEAVGLARCVETVLPDGARLALVRHTNPGRTHFWTAALEMMGASAGIEADWQFGAAHEAWGRWCATLARQGSLIRAVQSVTRIVPYDTADHTKWVMDHLPAKVDERLAASYVQLLDQAGVTTEQHRSWVVFRLPVTAAFSLRARQLADGTDGEASLVAREVGAAMHRASGYGLALRPLGEARLAAVLRSLQDPSWPIDKLAGLTFDRAWLALDQRPRGHVVVEGTDGPRLVRTAVVPPDGIEAGRFPPDFLAPLLSDVSPSVVRTISTVTDLVPVHVARSRARRDVTLDQAASREATKTVSDGSEAEQLTASTVRLQDLRPGTGHQGADWGMTVSVCARSTEELAQACQLVEDAAEEAHITALRWLDTDAAAGLVASLPLGRGLGVRR